jgi:hypothetical protein
LKSNVDTDALSGIHKTTTTIVPDTVVVTDTSVNITDKTSNEQLISNKDNDAFSGNQNTTTTIVPDALTDTNVTLQGVSQIMRIRNIKIEAF